MKCFHEVVEITHPEEIQKQRQLKCLEATESIVEEVRIQKMKVEKIMAYEKPPAVVRAHSGIFELFESGEMKDLMH
jgi:hypothetical protein